MSVLACNRVGCHNIMCDRYSSTFGYICDECFEELKAISKFELVSIRDFMNNKLRYTTPELDTEFLEEIFKK